MRKSLFLLLASLASIITVYAQPASITSVEIGGRALASQINFAVTEPFLSLGNGIFYWEGDLNYTNPNASNNNQGFKFVLNQHIGDDNWHGKWTLTASSGDLEVSEEGGPYTTILAQNTPDNKWRLKNGEDGFYRITVDASDIANITFTLDKDPEPLTPTTIPGVFLHFEGDNPNLATELQATDDENIFTLTGRFITPNKSFNVQINKGTPTWLNATEPTDIPLWEEQTLTASETDGTKFTFTNLEGWYTLTVNTLLNTVKIAPPAIEKIYITGRCPANVGGYGNSIGRLDELVNEGNGVFSWTGLLTDIQPSGATGADFKFSLNDKDSPWQYTLTAENANTIIADGQTYKMRPTGDIAGNFSDTKWKLADANENGAYKLTIDTKTLTMLVEKAEEVEGMFISGTALPVYADAHIIQDPSIRMTSLGGGKFSQKLNLEENGTLNIFENKVNKTYLLAGTENEQITSLCQTHGLIASTTEGEGFVTTLPTGQYTVVVDKNTYRITIIGEEECTTSSIPEAKANETIIVAESGNIAAYFDGSKSVEVYSITGQTLYQGVANNNFRLSVPQGVYILNIDGAKSKVLVK